MSSNAKKSEKPKKRVHGNAQYSQWLEPDGLLRLQGWARDGLTDQQIADNIGVTAKTLYVWRERFSKIREALKKGKDVPDREVENALFKSALGFKEKETRTFARIVKDAAGNVIQRIEEAREIEHYFPPNPTSIAIWLNNRKPDDWRKMTSAQIRESEVQIERKLLEAEKLKAELELLKAQTDRLSGEASTPFDDLLADMLMHDNTSEDESDESDDE